ncbi:carbohydrate porin [Flavobacterium album]|uniref:Carbohydrate porin n=1 Tax=Flavobacterium album TaxID=2175091 RepID=A0A2S1QZZ5_9FLAO|nr:carbohydrate porin [Flavobacterium album]AWH85841.1 carbohydrate porin [Flavobacterium album]
MKRLVTLALCLSALGLKAQVKDSINESSPEKTENFTFHAQTTTIFQYKPGFSADYTGQNSFHTEEERASSVTSTLFAGARLWRGASVYINPEMAGGSGLSKVLGIGDATNGETFRVGSANPKIYLARLYITQVFSLGGDYKFAHWQESGQNQLAGKIEPNYIAVTAGKICLSDYFDNNSYSHDPRSQFMNWGLMSNGAWDYPANTRGYVPSVVVEYVTLENELRFGLSLMPLEANGLKMNWNISRSNSATLEYTRNYNFSGRKGAIRVLGFLTSGRMGDYRESITVNPQSPVIEAVQQYGNKKYGFGINAEQELSDNLGAFFRASWNDGHTQTWAFTEIDRSVSLGLSAKGSWWGRNNDTAGLATVLSGISGPHKDYLAAGGYGFMLGDGRLSFAAESATEFYYAAELNNNLYITCGYQLLLNPGYNRDRSGPVNVFSLRLHAEI